jgi:glycosyltransferase involved in cell wall biosynthesis
VSGPLRVGLNLVYLVPGETGGMEVYARELIAALLDEAGADALSLTAFVNREAMAAGGGPWGELIPAVEVPVRARNRVEWIRGEQQYVPRLAARQGVDVVHSLASTAPLWGDHARVVTIHDLIYHRYREAHAGIRSLGMRMLLPLAARRAHRVVADSESTRRDIVEVFRLDPSVIDVVHLGVGQSRNAAPMPEAELRARHGMGERPVVLSVSAKRPHKNLLRLLEALALVPEERRPVLVIPGYPTQHEQELRERAEELSLAQYVRFLGWVAPEELEGLYAAASCFVFPSLYEGFGLPILEAMVRGVPVACSDRSSLPEVAGDAALLFDPESAPAIAAAMETLLSDAAERDRLRAAGLEQARRFTWAATARGTLASYEAAVRARSRGRGRA